MYIFILKKLMLINRYRIFIIADKLSDFDHYSYRVGRTDRNGCCGKPDDFLFFCEIVTREKRFLLGKYRGPRFKCDLQT